MNFNVKTTAIMTALLLVGSAFVVAGSASADHVYDSDDQFDCDSEQVWNGPVFAYERICVVDQSEEEPSCDDGSYEGATIVDVETFNGVETPEGWVDVIVEGFFDGHRSCGGQNSDGYILGIWGFETATGSAAEAFQAWNQDSAWIYAYANGDTMYAQWGGGDDCVTIVSVNGDPVVNEGCPAGGPPGAPNPGWGHLTPATP